MIVSGAERSSMSGIERLRLNRSSNGNTAGLELVETAGQPSDDGCLRERKSFDSGARVDLANASGLGLLRGSLL